MTIFNFIYWQSLKGFKSQHFNKLFFLMQQISWPLLNCLTYYLFYSPLFEGNELPASFDSGFFKIMSYIIPGILVLSIFNEYINTGAAMGVQRDYGILEPIYISPVNRTLWLISNAAGVLPSFLASYAGFLISAHIVFRVQPPNILIFIALSILIFVLSLPWGSLVCAIFLTGRNMRLVYALFETPSEFLSGIRFPVAALPGALSFAALAYPLSHCVKLLRTAYLPVIDLIIIGRELATLSLLAVIYLLASSLILRYAEYRGKVEGTLTFT